MPYFEVISDNYDNNYNALWELQKHGVLPRDMAHKCTRKTCLGNLMEWLKNTKKNPYGM